MDKKVFVAVALCAGIFLLWQKVYLKPYSDQRAQMQQAQQQQTPQASTPEVAAPAKPTIKPAEAQTITLGTPAYGVNVSTKAGVVTGVNLPEYRGQKAHTLDLLIGGSRQLDLSSPSPEWNDYFGRVAYSVQTRDKMADGRERLVLAADDEWATIQRTYILNASMFSLEHDFNIKFKKTPPTYVFVGLRAQSHIPKAASENERRKVLLKKSGGQEHWDATDVDSLKEDMGEAQWTAVTSRYFLNALIDRGSAVKPQFQARPIENGEVAASLIYKVPGPSVQVAQTMYYGPKDTDILSKVGNNLQSAVDFGWFTIFAYPMLTALKWFYRYIHNYGIAIILLTLLVKVITYPLTLKSMKSMREMQRIQPQLTKLREKYADDKEKLNREMLQLMRANGYNPASGCLPIFIQMPIFIALYNVLYGAIDLYGQPFFGWITNLSAKDPYYVTPVLLALMMFVQQKLTPNTASDPAQQRMMMMMPLIFGFMMLWLPSGLTLYMLVNSVVSVAQQFIINRSLGMGSNPGAPAAA